MEYIAKKVGEMIIDIETGVDESVVKWKYNDKDKWRDADIDELIHLYESVVHCKDCRHAEHREQMPNQVYCKRDKLSTFCAVHDDDDFCKYGKRKGGAE